jgi:hypothetical protein
MNDTLTLPVLENVSRSTERVAATRASTRGRPPLFVPRGQLYYWTHEWQDGEAEALREIADGQARRFPNGSSAAEWLLSDDEDSDA